MPGTKKDYWIVTLIGLFFGLFLLPVLRNIELPFVSLNAGVMGGVVVGFAVLANAALYLAFWISRWVPIVIQVAKFGAVGGLNTMVDLGVLNILIFITGTASGAGYMIFKGVSFVCAVINSYFLNRYWRTFDQKSEISAKEFSQFLLVSVIGLLVNVGVASFLVNILGPQGGVTEKQWATISAFATLIIVLLVNFVGYKFFVFRDRSSNSVPLEA